MVYSKKNIEFSSLLSQQKRVQKIQFPKNLDFGQIYIDAINHPAAILGKDFKILYANNVLLKTLNLLANDVIGKYCYQVYHSKKNKKAHSDCPLKLDIAEKNKPVQQKLKLKCLGGMHNVVCTPVHFNGEVEYIIHIATNIEDTNPLENKVKNGNNIFEDLTIGMFRTTPEGKILMLNKAALKMLGFKSFSQIQNINIEKHNFFLDYTRTEFKKELEEKGQIIGLESTWLNAKGKKLYVRENVRSVKNETNKIIYYEGTIEDITEKHNTQLKIEKQHLVSELRANFWQMATDIRADYRTLIYKLLEESGKRLNISRTCYYEYIPGQNLYKATLQWKIDQVESTIGNTISYKIIKPIVAKNKIYEIPKNSKQRFLLNLLAKFKIKSLLAIASGNELPPKGLIIFSDCNTFRKWDKTEKDTLREIVRIINLREKQNVAEKNVLLNNQRMKSLLEISQFKTNSILERLNFALREAVKLTQSKIGYIYYYNNETLEYELSTYSKTSDKQKENSNEDIKHQLQKSNILGKAIRARKPIIYNEVIPMGPTKKFPANLTLHKQVSIPVFEDNKIVSILGVANKEGDYKLSDVVQLEIMIDSVWKIIQTQKYQEDLIKAKEQAEESDRLKSAFLANMSHEIRTPMNSIVGFSNLVLSTDLPKEKQEMFLKIVNENSQKLLSIIEDIIEISKIQSGKVNISPIEIDIHKLLIELYQTYNTQNQNNEIVFVMEPFPNKETLINSDIQKLRQILNNLLSNAFKFTTAGTINLGYNITDNEIIFYVKDTGYGIPEDKQKIIFKRFRRLREDNIGDFSGTGLGLTISKTFVELLGGNIWVDSIQGIGSTFYFSIPCTKHNSNQ